MAKRAVQALLGLVFVGAVVLVAAFAFFQSAPGKKLLARALEREASRFLNGTLSIGELRGNLPRTLTLSRVVLRDRQGRIVARVAKLGVEARLVFPEARAGGVRQALRWRAPQILLARVWVEQPEVLRAEWRGLLKNSGQPRAQGARDNSESARAHPFVWAQHVSVVEGRFETVAPINLEMDLPETPDRLPLGRIFAGGSWRGLPVHLAATSKAPLVSASALSAVAKNQSGQTPDQAAQREVALVGQVGKSKIEATWQGVLGPLQWARAQGDLRVSEFHYDGAELSRRYSAFPKQLLEAKGYLEARTRSLKAGAEVHVARRGKLVVEGRSDRVARVFLDRLRLQGACPLFVLSQPAALEFRAGDFAPAGRLELRGCAGLLAYEHDFERHGHRAAPVRISVSELDVPKILETLSVESGSEQANLAALAEFTHVRASGKYDGRRATLVAEAGVRGADLRLHLSAEGIGTIEAPHAKAELDLDTLKGRLATLDGSLDGRVLDATLSAHEASIDSVVALLSDRVRVEGGVLDADFHLSGELGELGFRGYVRLAADTLRLPEWGMSYNKINLRLRGPERTQGVRDNHPERAQGVLGDFSASSDGGSLAASGRLSLGSQEAMQGLRLHAELKDFEVSPTQRVRAQLTGKLDLAGTPGDASFRGRFDLEKGRVTIPQVAGGRHLEPLGALEDVRVATGERREQGALLARLHGAVDVKAPGNVVVVSADKSINVELGADLQAGLKLNDTGGPSTPFVQGVVKTVRGDVEVFGRRLELKPSEATFFGDPASPHIDASGIYRTPGYGILVSLNGDLKQLKPKFSSDPVGLSEDQCLGVLLTGNPDYNSGTGGSTSAGTVAGNVASGYLLGQLKSKLGAKLPIDLLSADLGSEDTPSSQPTADTLASSSANTTEGRRKIEIGKYISDRIFVKLGHVFSTEDQAAIDTLMLSYRLSSRWSIETSQTDQGQSDVQVLWTLNY